MEDNKIDVEDELAKILQEEIMKEFASQGTTQEDIDRLIIEKMIKIARLNNPKL